MPPKDKKDIKPPAGKWYEAINSPVALLIFLFAVSTLATVLMSYLASFNFGSPEFIWFRIKNYFLINIWPVWKLVSAIVSALCLYGIIHNLRKLRAINEEEDKIFNPSSSHIEISSNERQALAKFDRNEKWEKIIVYMNSTNPAEWRVAIMEADVMLEETLNKLGLHGDSLGEMLKSANRNDFSTLDDAWEAHKVRNAIAHTGSNFDLNERETKRVLAHYEKVFREFGLI